jgi:hypothetical protein
MFERCARAFQFLHLNRAFFFSVTLSLLGAPSASMAQVSTANSYFVPEAGPLSTPTTGLPARRFFRLCPNNDGGASLPNRARIKIVLLDALSGGVMGLVPYIKVNGGTSAQGFSGNGADSMIANDVWNVTPPCPNLDRMDSSVPHYRYIDADGATDGGGVTYITFTGAGGVRDPNRKWGHYATKIPVYVLDGGVEKEIQGRVSESDATGYILQIKNLDWTGGLGAFMNQGEVVSAADFNGIANGIGIDNPISFWKDFDWSATATPHTAVTATDLNIITGHISHDCDTPNP